MGEYVSDGVRSGLNGGVGGTVAAGWEPVREEFAAFVAAEPHSPEAQLVVHHRGRRVVDLWAGEDTDGDTLSYTRRRFGFPGGRAPENDRLTAAVLGVARGPESAQA
ncbi:MULTISPECIES: hypothetical protein [unclassified Streptomyces]|uniref:hypothetical protein n=1 Tax=unclassified Streptomyces TaxID=2593676 RepID=UPI0004BD7902